MDSNIASDPSLRKRNSPCKHCRQQRRKCIREDGPCSRCQQMQLVCVNDNVLNASAMIEEIEQEEEMEEKSRMVGKVAEIQRQLAELGDQLEMMKTALDVPALEGSSDSPEKDGPGSPLINSSNTANTVQTEVSSPLSFSTDITSIDPVRHAAKYRPPTSWTSQASDMDILRRLDWKLTLRSDGMLRIHTSIRSFQDLIDFGVLNNDHMHPDDPSNPLSLAYLRRSGHRTMRVTMTVFLLGESCIEIFRDALEKRVTYGALHVRMLRTEADSGLVWSLYDSYFDCLNLLHPLLYRPTITRIYYNAENPTSSAVVCVICAVMASQQCGQHALRVFRGRGLGKEEQRRVANWFAERTRELLGEVFDEPSLGTLIALIMLLEFKMVFLDLTSVSLYSTMALSIAEALRPTLSIEPEPEESGGEDAVAVREMYKRSYYTLLIKVGKCRRYEMYGPAGMVTPQAIELHILGIPRPLPGETRAAARCVQWFRALLELGNQEISDGFTAIYHRYSRASDRLPIEACLRVEESMIAWYAQLPASFRLTQNLFQYISPEEMDRTDPYTLNLAMFFYVCWMGLHVHFLPPVGSGKKRGAGGEISAEERRLSFRSLTICVKAANIVTAAADHMHQKWYCRFDSHLLLHACDVHLRLSMSDDVRLAAMGRRNLKKSLKIVKETIFGTGGGCEVEHVARYYTVLGEWLRVTLEKLGVEF